MPSWLIDLATIGVVIGVVMVRPVVLLFGLVVLTVLVPPSLAIPHTHTAYLTFQHVLMLAATVRVISMRLRRDGDRALWRLTPAHVALALVILISFFVGVVFVVDTGTVGLAGFRLADEFDQLLFFTVTLILLRQIGSARAGLQALAAAVVFSSVIAVAEHATGGSFGHWLFSRVPDQQHTDAAQPLQPRAGQLRVRAGTEFALQWGWIVTVALPALVVVGLQLRARVQRLAFAGLLVLVGLALYWSYTRSALAAVAVALVLLVVFARDRRVTIAVVVLAAVALFVYAVDPSLGAHYNAQADEGSITIRFQRLAPILDAVSRHPFRGLGLGDLLRSGFPTADNAFLLQYAEVGALGLTTLVVVLIVGVAQAARPLTLAEPGARSVAAAAAAGGVLFIGSAVFYDAFTLLQGARLFWLLVAVGTVVAELQAVPVELPRPSRRLVVAGAGVGLALGTIGYAFAPVHFAVHSIFTTLPVARETVSYDPVTAGTNLVNTTCGIVRIESRTLAGAHIDCSNLFTAAGMGSIRFEGGSRQELITAAQTVDRAVRVEGGITHFVDYADGPVRQGRATVWATAPGWAPLATVALLLTVPWRRRPRLRE